MVATGENLFTRAQLKIAQLSNFSSVQLQVMLTNLGWGDPQVPHMSVEMESSSIAHFRAPKLDSFSEPPSTQSLEKPAFKLRVFCLFLKLGRVKISLCKCHYSAFIKFTVWAKSQLMACAKERRKKGKGGRDSHTGMVHRRRDRAARHSCKAWDR